LLGGLEEVPLREKGLKKKSLGFLLPYYRETENVRNFLLAEKILEPNLLLDVPFRGGGGRRTGGFLKINEWEFMDQAFLSNFYTLT
jgi:hypothetical protein